MMPLITVVIHARPNLVLHAINNVLNQTQRNRGDRGVDGLDENTISAVGPVVDPSRY
jgi:hypothetical protein